MRVKLNKFNVYPFMGVFLMPGWNDVPDHVAREMLKNPIVKLDVEAKVLEIELPEIEAVPAPTPKPPLSKTASRKHLEDK